MIGRQPQRRRSGGGQQDGATQLRVYFARDDNDDGRSDYIGYYSGDNSTSAKRPQLVVTYR